MLGMLSHYRSSTMHRHLPSVSCHTLVNLWRPDKPDTAEKVQYYSAPPSSICTKYFHHTDIHLQGLASTVGKCSF
jgi:hypothetical protein